MTESLAMQAAANIFATAARKALDKRRALSNHYLNEAWEDFQKSAYKPTITDLRQVSSHLETLGFNHD